VSASALNHLPHGPEFRFIDRLIELDPGKSGRGEYKLRGDEPFLKGHFPDDPIMPGVLLIEAAAQLAGVVAQSDPERMPLAGLKLTAVRNGKILGTARPGEIIVVSATITGRLENLVQASAVAQVNGKTVFEGIVALSGQAQVAPMNEGLND
jgi:3-hydroxyacyl-[acyl-carrier-protein] dehydratase